MEICIDLPAVHAECESMSSVSGTSVDSETQSNLLSLSASDDRLCDQKASRKKPKDEGKLHSGSALLPSGGGHTGYPQPSPCEEWMVEA